MALLNVATGIGHTSATQIWLRGMDLSQQLIGRVGFVDAFFLSAVGRLPGEPERRVLDALLVTALDHGLTPSCIVARLTLLGAPEAMQGAVAAGLLGAGSRFLGPSTLVARQFGIWLAKVPAQAGSGDYEALAEEVVLDALATGEKIAGFGHPIHKAGDPRVPALRRVAMDNGFHLRAWRLAGALSERLAAARLPMNASGALGVTVLDMGLEPAFATALTLVARCAGLVAHLLEEQGRPIARDIWELVSDHGGPGDGPGGAA